MHSIPHIKKASPLWISKAKQYRPLLVLGEKQVLKTLLKTTN